MGFFCKKLGLYKALPFFAALVVVCTSAYAQSLEKIEPPFWWSGMQNASLQLMLYGKDIGTTSAFTDGPLRILKTHSCDSPDYLFVDVDLKNTKPGVYLIELKDGNNTVTSFSYELRERKSGSAQRQGINSSDAVYLITPDRFSNGDPSNDTVIGLEEGVDRSLEYGRHGGDVQGIYNHLEYIKAMGFTAIWLNPVLENDQPEWSYHGYSTTDYYAVDPRFGSNESYESLAKKASEIGVGMIMDIIVNHCGSGHWWMENPPFEDWINQTSTYTQTNHRKETLVDPYASELDRKIMVEGWFVPSMPDLNQRNSFMSTYLIQNSIWWIEYAHLSGIRQDTYSYPFKEFMTEWTCAIMNEYPHFFIVGEEWMDDPSVISYWQENQDNEDGNNSCLPSLMDFPLCFAINKALVEEEGWDTGLIKLYQSLTKDHHYSDPSQMIVFADNHDMNRMFVQLEDNFNLFRLAITYLMTTRGIPQLYYGTEILMNTGKNGSHGLIRSGFPGGWEGDSISAKDNVGLSLQQKEAQKLCRELLHWRQHKAVIHSGKLMHFIPENGVYVYFRYDKDETIMVIINKNKELVNLNLNRYAERILDYKKGVDVLSRKLFLLQDSIELQPVTSYILELN